MGVCAVYSIIRAAEVTRGACCAAFHVSSECLHTSDQGSTSSKNLQTATRRMIGTGASVSQSYTVHMSPHISSPIFLYLLHYLNNYRDIFFHCLRYFLLASLPQFEYYSHPLFRLFSTNFIQVKGASFTRPRRPLHSQTIISPVYHVIVNSQHLVVYVSRAEAKRSLCLSQLKEPLSLKLKIEIQPFSGFPKEWNIFYELFSKL